MRYNEIKHTITETPMNPSVFARSIEFGQDKGVMVGFEFEVCIPKRSIQTWRNGGTGSGYNPNINEWLEGKTVKDLIEGFEKYGRRTWEDNLNDLFKNKTSVSRDLGDSNIWPLYRSWVDKKTTEYTQQRKSEVLPSLKALFKLSMMNNRFDDHASTRISSDSDEREKTVKQVVIARLNAATQLDFNNKISSKDLKKAIPEIRSVMEKLYYETNHPVDRAFKGVADADHQAESNFRQSFFPERRGYRDQQDEDRVPGAIEKFVQFVTEVYGTDNLKELLKSKWAFRGRVNNTTDTLKEKLWFYVTPGAEIPQSLSSSSSNRNGYKDGAEFLKAQLKDSFGDNMTIFTGYHQDTKKLDRWYIEPDGSLRPDGNDSSAEVVSPPLPAREAMSALKTFYSKAADMRLYTNSSTGLHINVSIPDKLDVLKLALFVGDQHVLRTFGRENNNYARSILGNLQSDRGINVSDMESAQKELAALAKNLSGDHFATVNFNGKYVSFRHAGGDYLNKLGDITNTVGRFVYAMIIASNPAMYRDEYLKKLSAMVDKHRKEVPSTGFDIRTNGIPSVNVDFVLFPNEQGDTDAALADINSWLRDQISIPAMIVPDGDVAERMLNSTNGLATSTRELLSQKGASVCARAVLYPTTERELELVKRRINSINNARGTPFGVYEGGRDFRSGRPKIAVGVLWPGRLMPGQKAFTQAYRGLLGAGATRKKVKPLPLPEQEQ